MIPGNRLSTELEFARFIPPDSLPENDLLSYELGGIALQDPSKGLQYQTWTLRGVPTGGVADPVDLILSSPNTPAFTVYSAVGITEVSLTFDQNMNSFIAFVQHGAAKYRWFDPSVSAYAISVLPAGTHNPRVSLDDKRPSQIASSDIILGYLYNDRLAMRIERDRYTVEYVLTSALSQHIVSPRLYKIGMNKIERFQFLIRGSFYK